MAARAERPRVLMISDVYFPRINGVSTSIQTFRRDLAELGWPSLLVAPSYPQHWRDDELTQRVRSRAVPLDPEDRLMAPGPLLRQCRALLEHIELIHVQTPFLAHWAGLRLARAQGIKVVETYHTYFEEYFHLYARFLPRAISRRLARRITKIQCNAVDALISPSQPMADVLRAYGVRSPIEVIGTGLELARFENGDGQRFRTRHGIAQERPVALHVGRVAFEKNIEFLLDVLDEVRRQIPNVLLVIAGEGPAVPTLRARVRELHLDASVMFVGYLDRETELVDCYKAADAFVFASRTETQGLVLLEAMASGTPVVSTAVLGTKDILELGRPGALVVREDRQEFAAAVVQMLSDLNRRQELAEIGRHYVRQHWSSTATAKNVAAFYQQMVNGESGSTDARADYLPNGPTQRVGQDSQ
jgi:1,2-diacylglycerol 3-alpha-glucosyltransferase